MIPAEVRERFGLESGSQVIFREKNGCLTLEPVNWNAIFALEGAFAKKNGPSLVEMLQDERRREREREDRVR